MNHNIDMLEGLKVLVETHGAAAILRAMGSAVASLADLEPVNVLRDGQPDAPAKEAFELLERAALMVTSTEITYGMPLSGALDVMIDGWEG